MSACAASVRALAAEAISGFREGLPMASGPPAGPKYARFAFSTMNSLRRKTAIGSAILSRSLLTGLCVPTMSRNARPGAPRRGRSVLETKTA